MSTNSSIWLWSDFDETHFGASWGLLSHWRMPSHLQERRAAAHKSQSLCCVTHWSCANMTWKQCIFRLKSWHEWWLQYKFAFNIQSYSVYVNVESMCRLFDLISCYCTGWHLAQDYFAVPKPEGRAKDLVSFPLSFSHFQPFHILPPSPRSSVSLHAN